MLIRREKLLLLVIVIVGFFVAIPSIGNDDGEVYLAVEKDKLEHLYEDVRQGRNENLAFGTLVTLEAYIADLERYHYRYARYERWMKPLIDETLALCEKGVDPFKEKRGLFWRAYQSKYAKRPQLYSIYVPKKYTDEKPISLVITLHGGTSDHNVWLANCLGHDIAPENYVVNYKTKYEAKRHPQSIVVAPNGFGQIRWRWAGEQDVLDVIEDVTNHYNIDKDKIFLSGLSNGGIGSYTIGLKHASRFAAVLPLAGLTNWIAHSGSEWGMRKAERAILKNESAITYAKNAQNTGFRFFHGFKDPGFSVEQARAMSKKLQRLNIEHRYHEFLNQGHDLTHVLWRKLLIDSYVGRYTRKKRPSKVNLVCASSRATEQAWISLNERIDHSAVAEISAEVKNKRTVWVTTHNVERFTLKLDESPVLTPLSIYVDGQPVYTGPLSKNKRVTFSMSFAPVRVIEKKVKKVNKVQNDDERVNETIEPFWNKWDGSKPRPGEFKVEKVCGPLGDANYEAQVHVYGTQNPKDIYLLKKAAYLGARGWTIAKDYSDIRHPVVADSELTWELMKTRTVVLYGNGSNNSVLAELGELLPIKIGKNYIEFRGEKLTHRSAGARFLCPNPVAPNQYLIVAAGNTAQAVEQGGNLPIYLGDYIVYNQQTTKKRAFMLLGKRPEIETGFFTENWQLPEFPPDK